MEVHPTTNMAYVVQPSSQYEGSRSERYASVCTCTLANPATMNKGKGLVAFILILPYFF